MIEPPRREPRRIARRRRHPHARYLQMRIGAAETNAEAREWHGRLLAYLRQPTARTPPPMEEQP